MEVFSSGKQNLNQLISDEDIFRDLSFMNSPEKMNDCSIPGSELTSYRVSVSDISRNCGLHTLFNDSPD